MQTVTSSRLGFVAVVAAVVLGAGGVAFAGNALATPPGAKAVTATYDDCEQEQPDLDTVRPPKGWDDDCDEDEGHGVCPSATTTEPVEVILQHRKKPRPHETPYCPTPTATSSVPTEPPTSVPPTSEPPTSVPPTPTDTQTVPPTPTATQTTPTATPTPCDSTSDDDDCDVITSPPDFAG